MEEVDFFDSKIVKYLKIIEREKSECVCFGKREERREKKRD